MTRSISDIPETSSARMAARETNAGSTKQPNKKVVYKNLSVEEKIDAGESLANYCRLVELYNYIMIRAREYSLYLPRCMDYRIKAKRKKRLILTAKLSWRDNPFQPLFPLCVCLGRLISNDEARGIQRYHVGRIFSSQGLTEIDGKGNTLLELSFMLPELDKFAVEVDSRKYCLLVFASAIKPISLSRVNATSWPMVVASNASRDGEKCFYAKVDLNFIHDNWNVPPYVPLRGPGNINANIKFHPCILTYRLQYCIQSKSKIISIKDTENFEFQMGKLKPLEISFCLEEFGDREKPFCKTVSSRKGASLSPLQSPPPPPFLSPSDILRLKEGNVVFYYSYYDNKLLRVEVTENFTCSLCLVLCGSYKGLKLHLPVSHDLMSFEFKEMKHCPSVYVKVNTVIRSKEDIADGVDPKVQTFVYCGRRLRHRVPKKYRGGTNYTDEELLLAGFPTEEVDESKAIVLYRRPWFVPSISDHDNETPVVILDDDHEGVSDAILHHGPDCVPSISDHDHDDGTHAMLIDDHPGPDFVSSISVHDHDDGTHDAMIQDEQEEVSNAILHPGLDCVPLICDDDNGTHDEMLQDDQEGVSISNTILHSGSDYVPLIADHDHVTHEVPQIGHEGVSNSIILHPALDCVPSTSGHDHGTPEVPQARNEDKLPIKQYDPKTIARFEKRKFYHSHKYQPMSLEEALVDEDSEDELNEGAQEIEQRRKLAILDVPDHVKQFLPMWNAFIKKHRVLADGHMSWACEAFTKYHCLDLAQSPSLAWCWRLFMIKLINHGLVKVSTFHACAVILEHYRKQNQDPKS